MKTLLIPALLSFAAITTSFAKDKAEKSEKVEKIPSGFEPFSSVIDVQKEAAAKNKLIVIVIKGSDDSCPNCAAAMEAGLKTAGPGSVKIFMRATEAYAIRDSKKFPDGTAEGIKSGIATARFADGASCSTLVFDSKGSKFIAELNRATIEKNKDGASQFKKLVQEARKAEKATTSTF